MVRVGLVGCGTIGSRVALALNRTYRTVARITALHDTNVVHAVKLQRRLVPRPAILTLPALVKRCDLIIEAASAGAALPVATRALRAGRDVLIMSVGGLLADRSWKRLAKSSRGRMLIPSGALAALDGVKAMAVGRVRRVSLTTRKPPQALAGAPYVVRRRLQLRGLKRARVIFQGTPSDVVKAFPQNTNIAAALSLALGERQGAVPRIRVIADPAARRNAHVLEVEGDSGRLLCRIESRPSANPKTSELAVRSAIASLDRVFGSVAIGT
jgi:aspartate dehydrogenase